MLRHLAHQVAGDQGVLTDLGAHGVGGDGPVAQPGHQDQPILRHLLEQSAQLRRHRMDRPAEDVVLSAGEPLQGEGDIVPPGLAQGLLPPAVQHPDGVHLDPLPQAFVGLHPGQGVHLPPLLLPQLPGLQGQIGPPHPHDRSSSAQDVVEGSSCPDYFSRFGKKYPGSRKKAKKTVDFFSRRWYNTNLHRHVMPESRTKIGGGVWFAEYQVC